MVRLMYDSVNPRSIPRSAKMVAGYLDGSVSQWPAEAWGWWPDAVMVKISAVGAPHAVDVADVFDVEAGAIWPPERVVPLVVRRRQKGGDPTVYVNEMNDWAPTMRAFDRAGVPHPHWWVANYDGRADYLPSSCVARQYAHPSKPPGNPRGPFETNGHYDLSIVRDFWPGVDGNEMRAEDLIKLVAPGSVEKGEDPPWSETVSVQKALEFGYFKASDALLIARRNEERIEGLERVEIDYRRLAVELLNVATDQIKALTGDEPGGPVV